MGTINPFQMWQGSFVPNWLMRRPDINATAKLIYGRLCQYAGRDGLAYPSIDTLAVEVGIKRRQMCNVLKTLEDVQLIRRQIQTRDNGGNTTNVYEFLDHKWIHDGVQPIAPGGVQFNTPGGVQSIAPKENHKSLRESKGICLSFGEKDLALDDDTPTNRFIKAFQNKRPTAGHPLAKLTAAEIDETRLRIEEFIDWVGEARIDELIDAIFLPKRRKPASIKQAIMFAGLIVEKEEKNKNQNNGVKHADANQWFRRIQQWDGRETGDERAARNEKRIKAFLSGENNPAEVVA
jgi:hypothetical protein